MQITRARIVLFRTSPTVAAWRFCRRCRARVVVPARSTDDGIRHDAEASTESLARAHCVTVMHFVRATLERRFLPPPMRQ